MSAQIEDQLKAITELRKETEQNGKIQATTDERLKKTID